MVVGRSADGAGVFVGGVLGPAIGALHQGIHDGDAQFYIWEALLEGPSEVFGLQIDQGSKLYLNSFEEKVAAGELLVQGFHQLIRDFFCTCIHRLLNNQGCLI